jgi:hypothetical protein
MKCAHPECNRGIGLVSHRRGLFGKRLYCSRACRDNYAAEVIRPRPSRSSCEPSLFDLLFAPGRGSGMAASYASARVPASRKLARVGLIAGLCLGATLFLVDPGSAGNHVSGASVGNAQQSHQVRSAVRRCDPPPCPTNGNAAFLRK